MSTNQGIYKREEGQLRWKMGGKINMEVSGECES
jgi:hypothetical protein